MEKFMKFKKIIFFTALMLLILTSPELLAEANVSMSVEAKNTTDEKKEKVVVRQELPREIKKEDILEANGMEVKFDEERSVYYLYAEVDLDPQSSRSFKILLRDLWKINEDDFNFLKDQTEQRLESLKDKDSYTDAKTFRNKIVSLVDEVQSGQGAPSGDIQKRMDFYRTNTQRLEEIRQQVGTTDDFSREAQHYVETQSENKFIKFNIEVKNPSESDIAEDMEVIRYLPQGVRPEHVRDAQGFDIKYDPDKSLYYLTSTLDFQPEETKKFTIILSDVWFIPDARLAELEDTDRYTSKLVNTGYEELGAYLALEIKRCVGEIVDSQKRAETPEDKVATYANNLKKMDIINRDIEQLKRLAEAADKAKAKKISEIIKTVTPDVATTWKLIYATIAFLVIVALSFYFLWWGQIKAKQNQKVDIINTEKKDK